MKFYKYSATGNDFIVIDDRNEKFPLTNKAIVQKLCHRRFGIGADGILLLQRPSESEDFKLVILNSDGSRPSMCGNGTRAVIHFAHKILKLKNNHHYSFSTDGSVYYGKFFEDGIRIEMTEAYDQRSIDQSWFPAAKNRFFINTGVPHLVFEVADAQKIDLLKEAPVFRHHQDFSEGTNVNFFHIQSVKDQCVHLRTFERGVEGETFACGTGVMATALALKHHYQWSGEIHFEVLGGQLKAILKENKMFFHGQVNLVFQGELNE